MEEEKGIIIRFVIGHRLVHVGKMFSAFLHADKGTMTFSSNVLQWLWGRRTHESHETADPLLHYTRYQ